MHLGEFRSWTLKVAQRRMNKIHDSMSLRSTKTSKTRHATNVSGATLSARSISRLERLWHLIEKKMEDEEFLPVEDYLNNGKDVSVGDTDENMKLLGTIVKQMKRVTKSRSASGGGGILAAELAM